MHAFSVVAETASPVFVLGRGSKYARCRLKHRRLWRGTWQEAGTIVRVPVYAI